MGAGPMTWCAGRRRVLVVVRNGASLSRLHDCLQVATRDHRIVWSWTIDAGSLFAAGLEAELQRAGVPYVPWAVAVRQRYDLVIAAHTGPGLHQLDGPRIVVPHGVGANRLVPHRTGDRTSPVGFSRGELMVGDAVVPDHLGISDECLLVQLAESCPEALDRAFVMGDPAWDRIVSGLPLRERLRAELGVRPGQRLVVASTTWNGTSLWGQRDRLVERLLAQLPADEYRVLLVTHPNLVAEHSRYHLDGLLADARASGLLSVLPHSDWHVAPIVADVAVGDHGSVSVYLAALGVPFYLVGTGSAELAAGSTTGRFVAQARTLDAHGDLRAQLEAAPAPEENAVHAAGAPLVRHQGQALDLLQRKVYQVLGLTPEHRPKHAAFAPVFLRPTHPCTAHHVVADVLADGDEVVVERFPVHVARFRARLDREHVLVAEDVELDAETRENADVVVSCSPHKPADARKRVDVLLAELYCSLAGAAVDDGLVLRLRHGSAWRVRVRGEHAGPESTALVAAAVHAWLVDRPPHTGNFRFSLRAGDVALRVIARAIRWNPLGGLPERPLARLAQRPRVSRTTTIRRRVPSPRNST